MNMNTDTQGYSYKQEDIVNSKWGRGMREKIKKLAYSYSYTNLFVYTINVYTSNVLCA